MVRIDKYLADAGCGTRKEVKALIRHGAVSVNGSIISSADLKIDECSADVSVEGNIISLHRGIVLMLHKPAGYVTSESEEGQHLVAELIPDRYRELHAIGRLDKETEGLLLFTDDGELNHRITSPKYELEKEYYAETDSPIDQTDIDAFAAGITLRDGTVCAPAVLKVHENGCLVILHQGKYHQVRRMLASRGKPVTYLKRLREGSLQLGDLASGNWRLLSQDEIECLKHEVEM